MAYDLAQGRVMLFGGLAAASGNPLGIDVLLVGDSLEMAVYGAPFPLQDHPIRAVQSALDMKHALREADRLEQQAVSARHTVEISSDDPHAPAFQADPARCDRASDSRIAASHGLRQSTQSCRSTYRKPDTQR